MSNIRYNQNSTSIIQVKIEGVLAQQILSGIPHQAEESGVKDILGAIYRTSSNAATYSAIVSPITGEYQHSIERLTDSWKTPELAHFLLHSSQVSSKALDNLLAAIRDTYGDVKIDISIHTDPEEGWTKPVITVQSGMEDFDKLLDVEDKFFAKAENDLALLAILPFVVISQA